MFEKIVSAILSLFKGQLSTMEVTTELDKRAKESGERLDWRHSVVDLLKALKLDSSTKAREGLAKEFGHSEQFHDTADQNIWLHSELMKRVAARGIRL